MRKQSFLFLLLTTCVGCIYSLIVHYDQLSDITVSTIPATVAVPTPLPVMETNASEIYNPSFNQESVEAMKSYNSTISTITDTIYQRIYKKSYKEDCTLSIDELRYLTVSYYGFDNIIHTGELIVNKEIAAKTISIFRELYEAKYPIEKICLVDDYDADDNTSMAANNSSCFNYRTIDGTTRLSNHSRGLAIDINPLYNPYVRSVNGQMSVLPESGVAYVDRSGSCPYMIQKGDVCYNTFIKYGFTWGGEWSSSKDYQHFEITI